MSRTWCRRFHLLGSTSKRPGKLRRILTLVGSALVITIAVGALVLLGGKQTIAEMMMEDGYNPTHITTLSVNPEGRFQPTNPDDPRAYRATFRPNNNATCVYDIEQTPSWGEGSWTVVIYRSGAGLGNEAVGRDDAPWKDGVIRLERPSPQELWRLTNEYIQDVDPACKPF